MPDAQTLPRSPEPTVAIEPTVTPELIRGRRYVLLIIAALLSASLLVSVTYNLMQGSDRLPQQAVRFGLTCLICFFMYRRSNWARWITVVLTGPSGLFMLLLGASGSEDNPVTLIPRAVGGTYVLAAIALVTVPSVKAWFRRS